MCGIVGLFAKNPEVEANLGALLAPMLYEMSDRGPDSAGVAFYREPVAAGHTKLTLQHDDVDFNWSALRKGIKEMFGAGKGIERRANHAVIVAHADLPHAEHLEWLADYDGVTLVPDRHGDGTNVIVIPTDSGFVFSYGPSSFKRHEAEAKRLGLAVRVIHDDRLAWDVDRPEDLVPPDWGVTT